MVKMGVYSGISALAAILAARICRRSHSNPDPLMIKTPPNLSTLDKMSSALANLCNGLLSCFGKERPRIESHPRTNHTPATANKLVQADIHRNMIPRRFSHRSLSSSPFNMKGVPCRIISLRRAHMDFYHTIIPPTSSRIFKRVTDFPNFDVTIEPLQGFYRNGKFTFGFRVSERYPLDPPEVKCITRVFHPNIDLQGNVLANFMQEHWKPYCSFSTIISKLSDLLIMPNTEEEPLNQEAAKLLRENPEEFTTRVQSSIGEIA
eukprot:Gb_27175 [translate_table: standard]